MKKTDWALVVLIVAVVGIAGYFVVNAIVPPPNKTLEKVETATRILPEITPPNKSIFNEDAINPTVKVRIGDQGDQQPFSLGRQ